MHAPEEEQAREGERVSPLAGLDPAQTLREAEHVRELEQVVAQRQGQEGARPDVRDQLEPGAEEGHAPGAEDAPDVRVLGARSEERRVGKECRSRWGAEHSQKQAERYRKSIQQ